MAKRFGFEFNSEGQAFAFNNRLTRAGISRFKGNTSEYVGTTIKHPTLSKWMSECQPMLDEFENPIIEPTDQRVQGTVWQYLLEDLIPSDILNLKEMTSDWFSDI